LHQNPLLHIEEDIIGCFCFMFVVIIKKLVKISTQKPIQKLMETIIIILNTALHQFVLNNMQKISENLMYKIKIMFCYKRDDISDNDT
jgi:flagellar motor component MotA